MHAPSMQMIFLRQTVRTILCTTTGWLTALSLSESSLAQGLATERAAGPTLGGFFNDMSTWGANHPGAAIALSAAALMAIGMIIYNRFKSKAP